MDPKAFLSLAESSRRIGFINYSILAVPATSRHGKPDMQAVANKTSATHYTEENRTIPETRPSQVVSNCLKSSRTLIS
jgi:hypothetical protein